MSAVSEIMSPKRIVAASVRPGLSALDVAGLMARNGVGSVVLVDGEKKPVGIVTERDILRKVSASNRLAGGIAVEDIMSSPVMTVNAYDSIETAAALMAEKRITEACSGRAGWVPGRRVVCHRHCKKAGKDTD